MTVNDQSGGFRPPGRVAAPQDGPPEGRDTSPCRLLIVDDDESVRAVLARVAASLGFEVATAVDGRTAAQWLAATRCQVLLTDIHMPETDDLELIRCARTRWPSIVIVAMSGGGNFGFDYLRTAQLLGADHVLSKPFEIGTLAEILQRVSGVNAWATGPAAAASSL